MDDDDLEMVGERYRLGRQLGQGGMASVWVASDLEQGGEVAIKFLAPEYAASAGFRERFEREAIALQRLAGPDVVAVHTHGVDQHGRPHIVMELLDGEDLQARLSREIRLSLPEAAALLGDIAAALHRAHEARIVHRDLKPANVFFALTDGGERVKLVDFGIAKLESTDKSAEATKTGMVFGTFNYMSPEQMRNAKDVDHRSDLWSLGVIAFRAVTGELPFPGQDYPELFPKICYDPIPKASEVVPDLGLSAEMDAFFDRALERDRRSRFQDAREFAAEFDRIVHARPSMAVAKTTVLAGVAGLPLPPPARKKPAPSAPELVVEAEPERPQPVGEEEVTVKSGEQSTGGLTMQPAGRAERSMSAMPSAARGRLATLAAGIAGGALVAGFFMWRDRQVVPAATTAAPVPIPTARDTSMLAVTASVTNAPNPAVSAVVPTSTVTPTVTSTAPPPVPTATAATPPGPTTHPTAPPIGSGPLTPPRATSPPVPREKDPYCRAAYPDKPYASTKQRPGCAEVSTKYCCP